VFGLSFAFEHVLLLVVKVREGLVYEDSSGKLQIHILLGQTSLANLLTARETRKINSLPFLSEPFQLNKDVSQRCFPCSYRTPP